MRFGRMRSCLAALLFASLVVATAFAIESRAYGLVPYVFAVALAHAVMLGLPIFLYLNARGRAGFVASIVAGFAISALPVGLLTFPLWSGTNFNASTNGVPTVINGVATLAGWLEYLQYLGLFGGLGAIAGVTFWATLRATRDFPNLDRMADAGRSRSRAFIANGLAILSLVLTAGAFALPTITKDRTCHNMFRDGRRSVGSQVRIVLEVAGDDWPRLTQLFRDFAAAHELSFRDSSRASPGVVQVLGLSLCNDRGVNIEAIEQIWQHAGSMPARDGVLLGIYELHDGSGWRSLARELVAQLQSTWPQKLAFKDHTGHIVPMPAELRAD
jgi:hypothetical protein